MSQPKDNAKVLCYWGPDEPGGEAVAICTYENNGFCLDGELQISPTWWEYLDDFETPTDAKLRSIIRDLQDKLSRCEDSKINRTHEERQRNKILTEACEDALCQSKDLPQKTRDLLAKAIRVVESEKPEDIQSSQYCAECERLARELERWKPKPMSEAPRDEKAFIAFDSLGWATPMFWYPYNSSFYQCLGLKIQDPERFLCWLPLPTAEELKQIGGAK